MIYVPDAVPSMSQELRKYLALKRTTEETLSELDVLKIHYQEAVSELHYLPEIQLLELMSKALSDNSSQPEILEPFHSLCFSLFKAANIEIPSELRVANDPKEETDEPHHNRQKRSCRSLENDPNNDKWLGMCGRASSCWSWVCNDCCFHTGCCQHDLCCRHNFWSSYCLAPIFYGFSCDDFGGHPDCLAGLEIDETDEKKELIANCTARAFWSRRTKEHCATFQLLYNCLV